MSNKSNLLKYFLSIVIIIFSFFINFYYANIGLYPIDTFSFFDSGYNVLNGYHPIKDYWVISGILVDYIQSVFFYLFGLNWNAYIFHSSFFNVLISLIFFFFLNQFTKNLFVNFILSLSVGALCYPVVGTPFPYQHSLIISLISMFVFYLAIEKEKKIYWIMLPNIMLLSFLSMQLPSGLINLIIIFFSIIYYFKFNNYFLKFFIIGSFISLTALVLYFIILKISFSDFLNQLIFFPLTVGEGRILNEADAFVGAKLVNKFTFRGVISHFKFLNIFIIMIIISIIFHIRKNQTKFNFDKIVFLNIFVLLCIFSFIFHQLITANQTFIFSLIPILCGLLTVLLKKVRPNSDHKIGNILLMLIVLVASLKYHFTYNEQRKFLDLQNINLSDRIDAKTLDKKFNKLQWITPTNSIMSPLDELDLIGESLKVIKEDKKSKMIITHYQFFSLLLEENLNIPNRWYFPNNTFPSSKDNIFYDDYLKKIHYKLIKKNIENIYIIESFPNEFDFLNIKEFVGKKCFKKKVINKILIKIELQNCATKL